MNIVQHIWEWKSPLSPVKSVDYIILHHAAATGSVTAIHSAHLARGWSGIGYNAYVRSDGSIHQGRPFGMTGAHTVGYNDRSVGVCFEGNFEAQTMPEAQIKAGRELIAYLRGLYPGAVIGRHKDYDATACPGKNFPFDEITRADEEHDRRYNTMQEVPEWGRATIRKMVDKGYCKGGGAPLDKDGYPTDINLSEDMLRILVINDRAGLYK